MVERHLQRVHGASLSGADLNKEVGRAFASYARYWLESFRLPGRSRAEVVAGMAWQGVEHVEAARVRGHGAMFVIPHLGGWEWGGAWLAAMGYPVTVVVEALDPPEVFEWFAEFRRALGMEVVAVGPSAGTEILRALNANHTVCLLSDRNVGGAGIDVEFFGERTELPAGPATLAIRTGAALLPAAVYFGDKRSSHRGVIRPPIPVPPRRAGKLREDVAQVTQDIAFALEELIRVAPEQWHLFQPNWPSDRDAAGQPPIQ
jgi:KDO2-lipid IV(A) lauroyltransferase